ncbi:uncharacterized protein [Antedon mediterranea]|uniref:uncharacterized protein n=1 Tax=Antedon mediterranea TaxID=105859 RepID=UPI003AF8E659
MTFITVIYGDNERRLFNPQCSSLVLLESIRKHCIKELENEELILDLSDVEGNIKHLPDNLHTYASGFLDGRKQYYLIKVTRHKNVDNQQPPQYTLMLENGDKLCPELTKHLQNLSKPVIRQRRESQWTTLRKKLPKSMKSGERVRPRGSAGKKHR